ncbi:MULTISPECIES: GNAT family N-acetyltransferase [unclassified Saccharopolyspora]|uniref:GNAT family N-acetyltransferase n=1 Tax=unclassified Saccharopolyspora TaxID=2646250 RepID=UPI001CD7005A|nr:MULTISPECIES: GNAT family N-acetyltransferase [unclassified Saccharopolyspora]MCA1189054.1 GNAT family N-acetyltransferase [Saccharopolyspora sp. 6T]MCA1195874.1 GNAT family N-acetyltransferase [Saccharopolyspora sp. 6V]MCA1282919.1 GNAT family N-acetyltransferase [Saccharopolyspora sp. 7B]
MIEQQNDSPSTRITFRRAGNGDEAAVRAIDGSFTTNTIFEVSGDEDGFRLREIPVSPPINKVFPADAEEDDEDDDPVRFVCVDSAGAVCGFIDLEHESWNGRMTISDVEISPEQRGRGIGRVLVNLAIGHARELRARTLWLEVTNINAPAINAYRRLGFTLCGLDTSLYRGTASEGETALFMSRDLT